jgi:hypothetical protein
LGELPIIVIPCSEKPMEFRVIVGGIRLEIEVIEEDNFGCDVKMEKAETLFCSSLNSFSVASEALI